MRKILIPFLLFLSACASTSSARISKEVYAPKTVDAEIEVFADKRPDRDYIEIGIIKTENSSTKSEKIILGLKEEARKLGADAIIIKGFGTNKSSSPVLMPTLGGGGMWTSSSQTTGTGEAVAIRWKESK